MRRQLLAGALVVIVLTGSAAAQDRDELWNRCRGDNADLRIGACTMLIQSGRETTNDLALAFHNRGIGYYDTDQYDKALADYEQEIKLNPSVNAFYERAMTYWAKRDYARALQDVDEALRRNPSFYLGHVMRGNVHDDNGQLDLAIQDYANAIKLEPSNARAYTERCVAYSAKGANDAAIGDCDKAIQLDPTYANAFATRGRSYAAKGDNDRAFADFDKALTLNPSNTARNTVFKSRALARFKRGEYPLALIDYEAALKLYPNSAESLYGRGMAKRLSGNVQGGDVDIASAKQLQADIVTVMAARGMR